MRGSNFEDPRYAVCAPTQGQCVKIYWNDFKAMIPPELMAKKPNESDKEIYLINGATIFLAGLDNPARIEGAPVDGFLFDEVDDIKRSAWEAHVFPCFIDRGAFAMFCGVPNGLQYLYELSLNAAKYPDEWDFFTWKSAEVLDPKEIANFKKIIFPHVPSEFGRSHLHYKENFCGNKHYSFLLNHFFYDKLHDNKQLYLYH